MVRAAYLGDGVFVQFGPGWLVLTFQVGGAVTQTINLSPEAWQQLLRVVRQYNDRDWPWTDDAGQDRLPLGS